MEFHISECNAIWFYKMMKAHKKNGEKNARLPVEWQKVYYGCPIELPEFKPHNKCSICLGVKIYWEIDKKRGHNF